jgi:hypothetical protein
MIIDPAEPDLMDRVEQSIVENFEPVELTPIHHFFGGMYGRELRIPAGTKLTGKIHRGKTLNVLSKGTIAIYSEGEGPRIITAPFIFVSEPGSRRLGIARTDVVWINFHFTDETDLERLEQQLIQPHTNRLLANHQERLL